MSADGQVTLLERELITLMQVSRLHHITRYEQEAQQLLGVADRTAS